MSQKLFEVLDDRGRNQQETAHAKLLSYTVGTPIDQLNLSEDIEFADQTIKMIKPAEEVLDKILEKLIRLTDLVTKSDKDRLVKELEDAKDYSGEAKEIGLESIGSIFGHICKRISFLTKNDQLFQQEKRKILQVLANSQADVEYELKGLTTLKKINVDMRTEISNILRDNA